MSKPTIKSLQAQINTLRELREGEIGATERCKAELARIKAENELLRKDKEWLQRMHSSVLQATTEMFRNR